MVITGKTTINSTDTAMDEETFSLLMLLMFGNHHQRQKANFKLCRKSVPNKLRLKAKHKGPGARLSLKQALHDAISKYEFEQRHSQPTVSVLSTRTAQNPKYDDSFARPQSGRPSAGPPQLDPNAPMRSREMISQHEPSMGKRVENAIKSAPFPLNIPGSMMYNLVDDAYVSFASLQRGNIRTNMAGEVVTGSRITDSGVQTIINLLPYTKLLRVKGLNAAQFSKLFKGTFINKLKPATRGFINRAYNYIYTRQRSHIVKGINATSATASNNLKSDKD